MPERHFILPEGACGEGISKGNIVPLGPPVGVRDPLRRGPGFLLLFSIKSKEERPCFAERVLNGRTTYLQRAMFFARLRSYSTGSKFLLLFSIKSKEESLCFAEKVPNGRILDVVQEKL